MTDIIHACRQLWYKYTKDEIPVYAAQASFFIILALFPFIMLLLTLIQFIPSVEKSDLLSILVAVMPDLLDPLVVGIVDDLYLKSPGTMLSVTAVLALWSAARGMMGIERGLNRIWETSDKRMYLVKRLTNSIYTLLFTIVCSVSLFLLVLGHSIQKMILRLFPFLETVTRSIISFRSLLAIILFLTVFVGIYTVVPRKRLHAVYQIPGAVFSAIGWMSFSYVFSLYFTNFSNYSYMYGSLTAIVLLMLWLYFCICIFFVGAEINYFLYQDEM
ncbi:MAG: YihY/virulence factor BrkB family protein [Brotaphodocola sp.]